MQAAKEYFCCSHQSSCCCSNLIWAFFRPDIKICKAGKVIFGQDKFCSLIIVKSCGWLLENCKRVQQCVNVLLYDLKGRKKMMMKFLCSLLLLFKMWKRSLILSISHFSYPAINLQMSSQSRSRSKAMNNKIEKVLQSKMTWDGGGQKFEEKALKMDNSDAPPCKEYLGSPLEVHLKKIR